MTDQILSWGDTSGGDDFFNKAELWQTGPQITTIRAFEMRPYFEQGDTLHIAFNLSDNGFANCTKPMKKALLEMYPGKQPSELINAPVMVQAQRTEAKGNFSAGYQIIISRPPANNVAPQPQQAEVLF